MPSNYYTFKKKNIQFFVMDTNFDFGSNDLDKQKKFLKVSINKSNKKWKILIGHHTFRSRWSWQC